MAVEKFVAIDLGAESGRGVIGEFEGEKLKIEEIHRFPTANVKVFSHIFWDFLSIFSEIKNILLKSKEKGEISGVGITTWGVDYGLIGENDLVLANPFHYRDKRTDGIMEEVFQIVPKEEIFNQTGIQFMQLNTLYQLFATKKEFPYLLEKAEKLLFMPDLFNFLLTGEKVNEYTIATTSQMYNSAEKGRSDKVRGDWCYEILEKLGIPVKILCEVVPQAVKLGNLKKEICDELNISPVPVYTVCCHDTASAVVAVPAKGENWAYISSGTWSLLGVELSDMVINEKSYKYNFTNEGGYGGTIRFLKNIMGLWILQECRRQWEREGKKYTYEELTKMASESTPFYSFINVADTEFLFPGNMPERIRNYCQKTNQKIPENTGQIVRVILESLAMEYRYAMDCLEDAIGKKLEVIHIVGGGSQNYLLSQFAASSTKKVVITGPVEATAIGNILIQSLSKGMISDISQLREIVRNSFPLVVYQPQNTSLWDENYEKYKKLKEFGNEI
ncbi:rhamnulokinase [bacterium]|nr:rhamnulokinase [bacterium]